MASREERNDSELAPGTLIRGKYRVQRVLGAGGMGKVVEAFDLRLERRVAIKVLHADLRSHGELVERFVREGRSAAKVEGENVAKVLDVDNLDDGTPFLVMEFLDGSDLSSVRRSRAPLPVADAIAYVLQACSAIAEAHHHGIIHRDIKPANLFLTKRRDGTRIIKVLDFGISKAAHGPAGSEPSMTRTSVVMGSAEYMSPEQMLSTRNVDARTDVWGLGAVLFELLTARPPFAGETMTQVCAMVMSTSAPSVRSVRAEVSERVEAIVERCLQKDRTHRFASVDELAVELEAALDELAIAPSPSRVAEPPPNRVAIHAAPLGTSVLPIVALPDSTPPSPQLDSDPPRESQPSPSPTGLSSALSLSSPSVRTSLLELPSPLPDLPRRSSVAAIALSALALALAVAILTATLLRKKASPASDPTWSAAAAHSSPSEPITPEAPSGAAAPLVVEVAPQRIDVPAPAVSASAVETPSESASAPPVAPVAPSAAVSARTPSTPPRPPAKPIRTSGID